MACKLLKKEQHPQQRSYNESTGGVFLITGKETAAGDSPIIFI
jgi:hypothetical protein